jgi:DNA polymerase-3 subunit delta'
MNLAPWHEELWASLGARLRRGALPHALLLSGPSGLGKRQFAERFVALALCEQKGDQPCGRCRACLLLAAGSHPDRVRVTLEERDDGKLRSEILVEQIRRLSERLAMTPQFGGHQLALIDPADAMNVASANALLKTLEEPTPGTVIVLVSDEPSRLVATIRSRCQRIEFRLPARAQALAWLGQQGVREGEAALDAAAGNPGHALALAQSGGLALRAEVARDLGSVWAGRNAASEVANRWAKAEAGQRLWFAAQLATEEAAAVAGGLAGPLALTPAPDFHKLGVWLREAGRTREQLRTPLRPELSILDLLLAWRDLVPRARRM